MLTDAELLQRYIEEHAEDAFAELVRRHLNLVYAAALRRTNGRHGLAEEIAQKVFTDLARKAVRLTNHPTLTGWLYRSTRYVAIDAMRIEQRREKLAHALTTMADEFSSTDSAGDWEQLRPVIDEAMDQLKEQDREIMLLRFFQGLSFAEVGERMNLAENTARMRTERALDKLRGQLGKRGITSTAALAGLLASQTAVAAPAALAASVTTAALGATPAGAVASLFTLILMNKPIIVCLSVALAAGGTSLAWAALPANPSETELATLRAENAQLTMASAPGAPAAPAARFTALVNVVEEKMEQKNANGPTDYRDHGLATPLDGARTMGWAVATGDVATLSKVIICTPQGSETNQMIFDRLPLEIRQRFHTLEEVMAFCSIAKSVIEPLPSVDVWDKKITSAEMIQHSPERVGFYAPGRKTPNLNMVLTSDGWKWEMPSDKLPKIVEKILSHEILGKRGVL